MEEVRLPENTRLALLLVFGERSIINDDVSEFVVVDPETTNEPLILMSRPLSIAILLVNADDPLYLAK